MHILLGILGILGVILTILWRMNQAADVARGAGEAVSDAQGLWRRIFWRRKVGTDVIRALDDAREGAAAMLVAVAQYPGAISEAELETMRTSMADTFGSSAKEAEELIARGRWLTRDTGDLGSLFMKLVPLIEKQCGPNEKRELVGMLRAVAAHGKDRTDVPSQEIDRLEDRLLPK